MTDLYICDNKNCEYGQRGDVAEVERELVAPGAYRATAIVCECGHILRQLHRREA